MHSFFYFYLSCSERIKLQLQLLQYIQEQDTTLQKIANHLPQNTFQHFPNGTFQNPAPSCNYIEHGSPSGYYWVQRSKAGYASQVYCNMTMQCSGSTGAWMRVANLNMTNPNHNCPQGFRAITSPKRMCGRQSGPGCVSTTFPLHGIQYQNICGSVIGYQDHSPNAFAQYYNNRHITIDDAYLDGVSITHGQYPRKHIWSFVAALDEAGTYFPTSRCPCTKINESFPIVIPPFVGQDYFCDTGSQSTYEDRIYCDEPLWDGHGCGAESSCCQFNSPPWFCKQLPQPTTDNIELRICGDQNIENEDVLINLVELYVQ